ncbi:MAG: hypothetical protein IPP90_02630 [Gemmatimonadaceae bacterium]|nr:hypothetical protein [Gemmatimonadaceae bacterium]
MRSRWFARSLCTATLFTFFAPTVPLSSQQPAKPAANRPAQTATPSVTYVKVIGADYAFETQDIVPAGIVAFNLVNSGSDLHAMAIFELPEKHTLREFLDQYHGMGMIPAWMIGVGQTPTIAPKAETFLTVRMKPGRYILACLIPARDGRMHTEKGMVKLITVK